ncbi:hypothetical protein PIIN_11431 [Serendipita indica DSM 11827]|uniref:Uncharacterized protein n=1 Tax=Serendipita indica (strain DSM 11827) TaxID=1109443 RepID=G4U1L1_SERID|nr:hypothetical protein PIIN_11431 [Serendipita indica DSM 11827]
MTSGEKERGMQVLLLNDKSVCEMMYASYGEINLEKRRV